MEVKHYVKFVNVEVSDEIAYKFDKCKNLLNCGGYEYKQYFICDIIECIENENLKLPKNIEDLIYSLGGEEVHYIIF